MSDLLYITQASDHDTLPSGYGYGGGVARSAIHELLGHEPIPIRDHDIVCTDPNLYSEEIADELASQHMPEDHKYSNSVRLYENPEKACDDSDFTVNSGLLFVKYKGRGELFLPRQTILDASKFAIRLIEKEKDKDISGRTMVRAIRLATIYDITQGEFIFQLPTNRIPDRVSLIDIAEGMKKSLELDHPESDEMARAVAIFAHQEGMCGYISDEQLRGSGEEVLNDIITTLERILVSKRRSPSKTRFMEKRIAQLQRFMASRISNLTEDS